MPDDGGVGIIESPDVVEQPNLGEESTQSTDAIDGKPKEQTEQEKQDGRKQPDALKKHIADLRRQADAITNPQEKQAALDRIKFLYDTSGKARGYEEQFPTVREARETRALLDSVGGREAIVQSQALLSEVEQNGRMLSTGDPQIVQKMWQEAPEGMPKLVPAIVDRLAKENPEVYAKAITPHALNIFESAGFLASISGIMAELQKDKPSADAVWQIAQGMKGWFDSQRNNFKAQQTKQVDPEVEKLRQELATRDQKDQAGKVDTAYNAVISHAGPAIDTVLKPMVAKLGLTPEAYSALRNDVWNHLQDSRNGNDTYKTVAPSKQRQGYDQWTEYAKRWTQDNAENSARLVVKTRYGHQLQNGAKTQQVVTKAPGAPQIQTGKEPQASEIDYGPRGFQVAKKAGYKDISDMILSGQAPLKAGGIRKWR